MPQLSPSTPSAGTLWFAWPPAMPGRSASLSWLLRRVGTVAGIVKAAPCAGRLLHGAGHPSAALGRFRVVEAAVSGSGVLANWRDAILETGEAGFITFVTQARPQPTRSRACRAVVEACAAYPKGLVRMQIATRHTQASLEPTLGVR